MPSLENVRVNLQAAHIGQWMRGEDGVPRAAGIFQRCQG
jgi:hypothetical protein